jgi:hypothetical protein
MSVGVMKDKNLNLRDLHVTYTSPDKNTSLDRSKSLGSCRVCVLTIISFGTNTSAVSAVSNGFVGVLTTFRVPDKDSKDVWSFG